MVRASTGWPSLTLCDTPRPTGHAGHDGGDGPAEPAAPCAYAALGAPILPPVPPSIAAAGWWDPPLVPLAAAHPPVAPLPASSRPPSTGPPLPV
jgi:hypothetical protein